VQADFHASNGRRLRLVEPIRVKRTEPVTEVGIGNPKNERTLRVHRIDAD
jgi:hypothetical protein